MAINDVAGERVHRPIDELFVNFWLIILCLVFIYKNLFKTCKALKTLKTYKLSLNNLGFSNPVLMRKVDVLSGCRN